MIQKKIRKNLTNTKIGTVTLLSYLGHKGKEAYWKALCNCGFEFQVNVRSLKTSKQQTCPRCRYKCGPNHYAWQGHGEIGSLLWTSYYHSARDRELSFLITIEYAWNVFLLQERKCAYTGWPIYFNTRTTDQRDKTASLDRIDSTKGYIEGNIQWIHRDINYMKKNIDDQRFLEICHAVSTYRDNTTACLGSESFFRLRK